MTDDFETLVSGEGYRHRLGNRGGAVLLGARCPRCSHEFMPSLAVTACPKCGHSPFIPGESPGTRKAP